MSFALYPIKTVGPGKLFISPMPDPQHLQQCLDQIEAANITTVVCLLEQAELESLGLNQWLSRCRQCKINPIHFAIKDFGTPPIEAVEQLVPDLHEQLHAGRNVLLHCRGGIGRSGLMGCSVLVCDGVTPQAAIEHTSAQRGCAVPETPEQRELIFEYYKRWS